MKPTLSICVMSGGKHPIRLAAILALLDGVADEIVVGVDERRAGEAVPVLRARADAIHVFPRVEPPDRPIPWLFERCSGRWIFNVDDDEVPSQALLRELPELVRREDVTHYWIGRRWLYPSPDRALDRPPWHPEYQLRLVLNDPRFLQYSDEFHRPVVCQGPMRFVGAPLWHLDTIVNDVDCRRRKVMRYERERPGMRIAGLAHNAAFYLPELQTDLPTVPVPDEDRELVDRVLAGEMPEGRRAATELHATLEEVDRHWPVATPDALLRGRVEIVQSAPFLVAGVQQTIDVLVTNGSETLWRWGKEAQPEIRLACRWAPAVGGVDLRTPLPADLAPGATQLVPVHVMPPDQPGLYRLELDLVQEFVGWLGCGETIDVEVRRRRRVAVLGAGQGAQELLDLLESVPEIEPVCLIAESSLPPQRFGLPRVPGLRDLLLHGLETSSGAGLVARLLPRSVSLVVAPARNGGGAFAAELATCEALLVAASDWEPGAAVTRELWRLATTVLAARRLGLDVYAVGDPLGGQEGALDRLLAGAIGRTMSSVPREEVPLVLARR